MCSSQPLSNTILKYIAFSHPSAGAIEQLSGLTELCWCHRNGAIRVVETWGGVFCPKHVWDPYGKGGGLLGKDETPVGKVGTPMGKVGTPMGKVEDAVGKVGPPWERWDPHGAARRCPPAGVCRVGISGALQWRNYGEHQIPASRGEPQLSGFPQVPADSWGPRSALSPSSAHTQRGYPPAAPGTHPRGVAGEGA